VVDAYNANPTSMKAAISNFGQMDVEHKVLILGDMFELGEQSDLEHQTVVELLKQYDFEKVILVGPRFKNTENSFLSYDNAELLLTDLTGKNEIKNCYVLIKGSRGIKLEKVLDAL